ncbi:hypothetical protein ACOSP7_005870 [Xanthoceras sorbifolium]
MVFSTVISSVPPIFHHPKNLPLRFKPIPVRCFSPSSPSSSSSVSSIQLKSTQFDLKTYWATLINEINQKLDQAVPVKYPEQIYEAMRYSDNEEILEAYVKSWTSGALDKAATRGSIVFTLVLHHLSSFVFLLHASDTLALRNKLVKSLLRDYSRQQRHERMMLDLIQYSKPSTCQMPDQYGGSSLQPCNIEKRFEILREACEGNSSLLIEVEKLKSSCAKN